MDLINDFDNIIAKNHSFAIVQLRPGCETQLLRVLLENGYTNVSFTNAQGETVKLLENDEEDRTDESEGRLSIDTSSVVDERRLSVESDCNQLSIDLAAHRLSIDSGHRSMESAAGEITATAAITRTGSIDSDSGRDTELDEEDRRAESEELTEDIHVDVDDEEDAAVKIEIVDEMIRQKEKALLESFYASSIEQQLEPCLPPMEFSSLTLPTVLWGAAAAAPSSNEGPSSSARPVAPFGYNPFLAVNPFLQQSILKGLDLPTASATTPAYFAPTSTMSSVPSTAAEALAAALWSSSRQAQAQQLLDTPPATPRQPGGGPMRASPGDQNDQCLITGAKLRQRGRQLRRHERDSSSYASCRLCRNRILANRLSNLHNHVRRHAVLKQFHCCYCSYAHTEVAKVRLHMLHNHKDDRSQPLDKRNDDMEAAWAMLMRECFPGYA